jgi:RHS repeat-associated protein
MVKINVTRFFLLWGLVLLSGSAVQAQVVTGTPPFASFGGGPDVVNLGNLNAHISIPIINKPGRGMSFTYTLGYDSSVWFPVTSNGSTTWQPMPDWGWSAQTEPTAGYITYSSINEGKCNHYNWALLYNWIYYDPVGVPHPFPAADVRVSSDPGCNSTSTTVASDGSGYTLAVPNHYTGLPTTTVQITSRAGKIIIPPVFPIYWNNGTVAALTDRNGNQITVNGSGVFTDTLGQTALTISQNTPGPTSPTTFTYPAPSGANAIYTMKYTNYNIQTNFGCSGIGEYSAANVPLVTEIDLPDQMVNPSDKYTFAYEQTPGSTGNYTARLASVTLPTGGTISYYYIGGSNGITCTDGSTAGLQRYTPDTGSNYWNYERTPGTGAAYTTTITDPLGNQTVLQFQGIYETQGTTYQGTSSLLKTVITCYNGNTSNCSSTAITSPITQRNVTSILPNGQQSEHVDVWNTYGAPTETDDYDYGSAPHGSLLKKVISTYAPLGNITSFRQTVTTQNGSGTTVSEITYNYDAGTPTPTSGTPQHVSVTTPRGNVTSTNTYVSASSYHTTSTTYYDTGNPSVFTDVNSGLTTYNYASGAASCYNSFPTSLTEAVRTLSRSTTWNCQGAVDVSETDENGQTTTISYTDPYFWRPATITDPTNAVTNACYGLLTNGTCTLSPTQTESTLNFNGTSSTVDTLTTLDTLGRPHIQQTRQAPGSSNFDSTETDYDALGRVSRVTLPYIGTEGQTYSGSAATTFTLDAMNRRLTVEDGGGGTTTYYYGQGNDVLVTRSPAPTWDSENTKRRQFEYDGLHRLTSTCEITAGTTAWPGGSCAQQTSQIGYWTTYTYDPLGNLTSLTQNAQKVGSTQSRTYAYDWMGRMVSETVPEVGATGNGTISYTYDSDSTCGTFMGDLVKRVDAAGNVVCTAHDALHRQTSITYPSGVYAAVTPSKHFVYDAATVNNQSMLYTKGHLAEAYTCFSTCATKTTDLGLSFTVRGEVTGTYESTPNSNGFYYYASHTYWANRSVNTLSGNIGLPTTISYGPDGEGRVNTVSATSGQNPVSGTIYNTASLPTQINYGSGTGDGDTYTWDTNTNRMTQYQFTANSTSLTGAIGWNVNGTLKTQDITDGFNSADTQNCSYGYDDITRIASANCGSAASQTFAYDPFGNINKSGSPYSFQASYSSSTNRITSIANFTPTYDNNGNVTNDNFHAYTWDAEGHAITIDAGDSDAVSLTYDALGRMVEQNRSGSYSQIVYSPRGQKLALMNGKTLEKGIVPLSGKALAVYSSTGLEYYAHADPLGSIRLGTSPSRTMYFDTAYAPFGETYASSGILDPSYTGKMDDTAHRQDTAGGLYDFPAREYSTQGRWPSPDPKGKGATCTKDPQTQNRYAYVRNNPNSYTDPTGTYLLGCDPSIDPLCGIGGCPPEDPFCGCPPFDPVCGCGPESPYCPTPGGPGPGGGGGGGGGGVGGGGGEQPTGLNFGLFPPDWFRKLFRIELAACTCQLLGPAVSSCNYSCSCSDNITRGVVFHGSDVLEACGPFSYPPCPSHVAVGVEDTYIFNVNVSAIIFLDECY